MKKRLIIAAVALAIIAIVIFVILDRRGHEDEGVLRVSGNVEVTETNTGFKMPGRVLELLAEEGDRVRKGERLASLEGLELESEVEKVKAAVFEAEAKLRDLRTGSRPQELKAAEADVRAAEADLAKAKKDFERADILFANGAISASQYDSFKQALDTASARHRAAVEKRSLVREGSRKEDIKAAEHRVKQAEAALASATERLKDTVLNAPTSGVVLRKNSELGETVGAGMPVYTIGDLENPWIKVYVKEDKLGIVKLGQRAQVTTDSYPGKVYEGTVTYISSDAEFTPKNVQTEEERVKLVFKVKVSVRNLNDELKPGMPADVRIFVK